MAELETFGVSTFSGHINTSFIIVDDSAKGVELKLDEVVDHGESRGQVQFALRFIGPLETPIMQSTYRIRHEQLGEMNLFLVPIGREHGGFVYEAYFNRFIKK